MPSLLVCTPDGTVRRRIALDSTRAYAIGRSPRCDIQLPVGSVSRRHALLFCHAGVWHVVDTGSRLGLSVGEREARRGTLVPHGTSEGAIDGGIGIGPVVLRLGSTSNGVYTPSPRSGGHWTPLNGHPAYTDLNAESAGLNARTMDMPTDVPAFGSAEAVSAPLSLTGRGSVRPRSELLLIESDAGLARLFDLRAVDHATIGYDPLCGIALACQAGLAPLHAVAFREPKAWVVVDAGGGVVSLGDRFRRRRLAGAVTVELGQYRLRMVEAISVEPRRADIAPRAVSAFRSPTGGVQVAEDDEVAES
ncbi:MAG: FHA domain-containing protein [Phycisphaerae bacterium]|nr:FHA domain-containing protein [Phycisphaerae bacterium]